jgi:cation:H+ antiporter
VTALLLFLSFVLIVGGAALFTNAVEWLGQRLDLGQGAVGSLLAAVGTALPESTIPVVAVLAGAEGEEVAIDRPSR